eukprot:242361_1
MIKKTLKCTVQKNSMTSYDGLLQSDTSKQKGSKLGQCCSKCFCTCTKMKVTLLIICIIIVAAAGITVYELLKETTNTTRGCLYHSADYTLNLTQYDGFELSKVDDTNNDLVYRLSPCANGLDCNGIKVNSNVLNIATDKCEKYLSIWKDGAVIPKYNENDKMWQFVYTNGEECDGVKSQLEIDWVCDPNNVNKAVIVFAQTMSPCSYKIIVNSSSACN